MYWYDISLYVGFFFSASLGLQSSAPQIPGISAVLLHGKVTGDCFCPESNFVETAGMISVYLHTMIDDHMKYILLLGILQ